MTRNSTIEISSETGTYEALANVPVLRIKDHILGKSYRLSLIYCSPATSQRLNKTYREKDYPTNILTFPLETDTGEIYICRSVAKRDAKKFEMSYTQFITLLIVHGCLHLRGLEHGEEMEKLEDELSKKFYN